MEREKKRVQEKMDREKKKDEVAQQKAAEKLRQFHEREAKRAAERAEKEKRAEERKRLQDEKRRWELCRTYDVHSQLKTLCIRSLYCALKKGIQDGSFSLHISDLLSSCLLDRQIRMAGECLQ